MLEPRARQRGRLPRRSDHATASAAASWSDADRAATTLQHRAHGTARQGEVQAAAATSARNGRARTRKPARKSGATRNSQARWMRGLRSKSASMVRALISSHVGELRQRRRRPAGSGGSCSRTAAIRPAPGAPSPRAAGARGRAGCRSPRRAPSWRRSADRRTPGRTGRGRPRASAIASACTSRCAAPASPFSARLRAAQSR